MCSSDEYCLPLLTADPKQWLQLFQIFPTAFSNPILSSCVHEDPRGPEAKAEPDLTNRSKRCLLCQDLPDTVHTYFIAWIEILLLANITIISIPTGQNVASFVKTCQATQPTWQTYDCKTVNPIVNLRMSSGFTLKSYLWC